MLGRERAKSLKFTWARKKKVHCAPSTFQPLQDEITNNLSLRTVAQHPLALAPEIDRVPEATRKAVNCKHDEKLATRLFFVNVSLTVSNRSQITPALFALAH